MQSAAAIARTPHADDAFTGVSGASAPLAGPTASRGPAPEPGIAGSVAEPTRAPAESSSASGGEPPAHDPAAAGATARERPTRHVTALKWLAAAAACAGIFLVDWSPMPPPASLPAQTPAAPATPVAALPAAIPPAPAVSLPKMTLITDPASSTDADIAADLARIVAADSGVELVVRSDVPFWTDDGAPRLAIARYEELQAAVPGQARQGSDLSALRVLTPLYTEEIYVIARRDSPLAYFHDLRDARINVGPDRSSRWLTAARLYERMFESPMPVENVTARDDREALARLLGDKSIDAMLVVAAQPARWLAELPPETARQIKLLALDPRHPAGRRAVGAYLPTVVRAANYGRWLAQDVPSLATMSFLVTSEYTDPAAAARVDSFARALCRHLADLRRSGHPKWREVQPGFDVDAGLPVSASARTSFQACTAEAARATQP